jgi:hypothetical protein
MTNYANNGYFEFYLFDALASPGAAIMCISCRPNGAPPEGDAVIGHRDPANSATPYQPRILVDKEGNPRFFFESYDSVLPQDQNGMRDVYEFDVSTGRVSLLSSGSDSSDSYFLDADESGANVFIATRAQLVGWDRDPLYDVYAVRIGGGVAEPALGRVCTGEECQGPPPPSPTMGSPASNSLVGPGNVPGHKRAKSSSCRKADKRSKAIRKIRKCAEKKHRCHRRTGRKSRAHTKAKKCRRLGAKQGTTASAIKGGRR